MDAVKEDMQVAGVRVEDTENRLKWKTVIRCGNAWKETSRKEKKMSWAELLLSRPEKYCKTLTVEQQRESLEEQASWGIQKFHKMYSTHSGRYIDAWENAREFVL